MQPVNSKTEWLTNSYQDDENNVDSFQLKMTTMFWPIVLQPKVSMLGEGHL